MSEFNVFKRLDHIKKPFIDFTTYGYHRLNGSEMSSQLGFEKGIDVISGDLTWQTKKQLNSRKEPQNAKPDS